MQFETSIQAKGQHLLALAKQLSAARLVFRQFNHAAMINAAVQLTRASRTDFVDFLLQVGWLSLTCTSYVFSPRWVRLPRLQSVSPRSIFLKISAQFVSERGSDTLIKNLTLFNFIYFLGQIGL